MWMSVGSIEHTEKEFSVDALLVEGSWVCWFLQKVMDEKHRKEISEKFLDV